MPTFYFSYREDGSDADPAEGLEFNTLHDACLAAEDALREQAAELGVGQRSACVVVLDESRQVVHRAGLAIDSDPVC